MAQYRVIKTPFGYVCQVKVTRLVKRWILPDKMKDEFVNLNRFGKPCTKFKPIKAYYRQPSSICHTPFITEREAKEWLNKIIKKQGAFSRSCVG